MCVRVPLQFEKFLENFMFYNSLFLRYLQYFNPISQISNNFGTKLGKMELFITFNREMMSAWTFEQLCIITKKNYWPQHFHWWCHTLGWLFTNEKNIFNTFGMPYHPGIWFLCKMEVNHIKLFPFFFQNLKTELKNLVSTKSYCSLKMESRF